MDLIKKDNPDQPYVEALQPIDEKILALLQERGQVAGDKPGIPTWKQVGEWAKRFELEETWLHRLFSNMSIRNPLRGHLVPENLRTVVPILKKTEAQNCLFEITHMMQYENASVVSLDIRYRNETRAHFEHHQQLTLTIAPGEYQVQSAGTRGGGTHMHYEFSVSPPLPDDVSEIHFGIAKGVKQLPVLPTISLDFSEPIRFE